MKNLSLFAIIFGVLVTPLVTAQAPYATPTGKLKDDGVELKQIEASYTKAKAAFGKTPKDAKVKSSYVAATVKYGTASMLSPTLDRKIKYKQALNLYREALKVDPANKEAKNNKDMIEGIYKQMGRPIPK